MYPKFAIYLRIHLVATLACVTVGLSSMFGWTILPLLARRSKLTCYLYLAYFGLVSSIRATGYVLELKFILAAFNALSTSRWRHILLNCLAILAGILRISS